MKKHYYKLIAGLMASSAFLSLTGCSGENGKSGDDNNKGSISSQNTEQGGVNKIPRGRYVEEAVELPKALEFISAYHSDNDGNVSIYGYQEGQYKGYTKQYDGEWTSLEMTALKDLIEQHYQIQMMKIGPEQSLYVVCTTPQYKYTVAKIGQDQSVEYMPIEDYPDQIEVLENGDFLIGNYGIGVTRYSGQDGTSMMTYYSQDGIFDSYGNRLVILDSKRGGVVFYDIATGEEINFAEYKKLKDDTRLVMDEQENTYIINSDGISRLVKGGSAWENILEANMSSFGVPSLLMMDVQLIEGKFYAQFVDYNGGSQVMMYTYKADEPTQPTTEMSVYMLQENAVIRQAIAEYQNKNKAVVIQVQVGMSNDDGVTKADAIRTLNTKLLAGKGPDILVLDGLPIDSYKDKGVLLDMSEDITPLIEEGHVFENIFKSYREEDGIYAVPTRFKLPLLFGDEALLDQAADIVGINEWAGANPDQKMFYPMKPEVLMTQFFGASAHQWIDEAGQIQADGFAKFLEAVKALSDVDAEVYEEPFVLELWAREYMAYNDTQLYMTTVEDFSRAGVGYSGLEHRKEGIFVNVTVEGQGVFEPMGIVGINAHTQYEDIAREIIKLSLSEKVQKSVPGPGFSVNQKAFNKSAIHDDSIMFGTPTAAILGPNSRDIEDARLNQGVYDQIKTIANDVTVPVYQDEVLLQIIIEETRGYFDETKTIDETVEAVTKRTKAYLAE